jgi:AcrR family transcriptional regulator
MSVADERRTDTRAQIREVALELFAEQGYDKTSLREIAERLGITKAAVYYHFKTKEEILTSLFNEFFAGLDELVAWARARPRTAETRADVLRRYQDLLAGPTGAQLIRFMQEGQAALKDLPAGSEMKERFARLATVLVPEDGTAEQHFRFRLAFIALHLGAFSTDIPADSPEERRAAALNVALDLAR